MHEDKMIFIIGSTRSGSTLLRLLMSCHPQIHILVDGPYQAFIKECIEREKGNVRAYKPFTMFGLLKEKK